MRQPYFSLYVKLSAITLVAFFLSLAIVVTEIEPPLLVQPDQFLAQNWQIVTSIEHALEQGASLGEASKALVENQFSPRGDLRLFSLSWDVVYDAGQHRSFAPSPNDTAYYLNNRSPYANLLPVTSEGQIVAYLWHALSRDQVLGPEPLYNSLLPYRIVLAILVFVFLIYMGTVPIRKRFDELARGIQKIAAGNLDYKTNIHSSDELGRLSMALQQMADQLQAAQTRREQMEMAKNSLIAGVSHDLRSPLTSILGYTEMLQELDFAEDDRAKEYLSVIAQKAIRVKNLVDSLFQLTRFRLGEVELNKSRINISDLVRQALAEFRLDFGELGREIRAVLPNELFVCVDGELISRVIENLLVNSYEHAKGATYVEIGVEMGDKSEFQLWIADDGCGIAPKKQDLIFQRWYRGDEDRKGEGGLGLAICREIVLLHGGEITVESHDGRKTKFVCKLPSS